jgi:hypothetical protein
VLLDARCARSIWRVSMPLSIASPAFMPTRVISAFMRVGSPKMRIRLSSSDR